MFDKRAYEASALTSVHVCVYSCSLWLFDLSTRREGFSFISPSFSLTTLNPLSLSYPTPSSFWIDTHTQSLGSWSTRPLRQPLLKVKGESNLSVRRSLLNNDVDDGFLPSFTPFPFHSLPAAPPSVTHITVAIRDGRLVKSPLLGSAPSLPSAIILIIQAAMSYITSD